MHSRKQIPRFAAARPCKNHLQFAHSSICATAVAQSDRNLLKVLAVCVCFRQPKYEFQTHKIPCFEGSDAPSKMIVVDTNMISDTTASTKLHWPSILSYHRFRCSKIIMVNGSILFIWLLLVGWVSSAGALNPTQSVSPELFDLPNNCADARTSLFKISGGRREQIDDTQLAEVRSNLHTEDKIYMDVYFVSRPL